MKRNKLSEISGILKKKKPTEDVIMDELGKYCSIITLIPSDVNGWVINATTRSTVTNRHERVVLLNKDRYMALVETLWEVYRKHSILPIEDE